MSYLTYSPATSRYPVRGFSNPIFSKSPDSIELFPVDGTGVYCSQDLSGLFADPITGTGVYCSQDLVPLTT